MTEILSVLCSDHFADAFSSPLNMRDLRTVWLPHLLAHLHISTHMIPFTALSPYPTFLPHTLSLLTSNHKCHIDMTYLTRESISLSVNSHQDNSISIKQSSNVARIMTSNISIALFNADILIEIT